MPWTRWPSSQNGCRCSLKPDEKQQHRHFEFLDHLNLHLISGFIRLMTDFGPMLKSIIPLCCKCMYDNKKGLLVSLFINLLIDSIKLFFKKGKSLKVHTWCSMFIFTLIFFHVFDLYFSFLFFSYQGRNYFIFTCLYYICFIFQPWSHTIISIMSHRLALHHLFN